MTSKNKMLAGAISATMITGVVVAGMGIKNVNIVQQEMETKINKLQEDNLNLEKIIKDLKKDCIDKDNNLKDLNKTLKEMETKVDTYNKENKNLKKQLKECPTSNKDGVLIKIKLTFYGDFAYENGGYAGIDCNGDKLVEGTVASNYYKQGTKFELNGKILTVRDRGGSSFNSPYRLDVFVPRKKNESDKAYAKRISDYGVKEVKLIKRDN